MRFKRHSREICYMTRLFVFHFVFISTASPRQSFADVFIFPPQNGYTGEYISNLAFIVGQSIDIKWQSGCDESIQLWLMKDYNGGDCQFQRDARCSQIAGETVLYRTWISAWLLTGADTRNNGSIAWTVSSMGLSGPGVYYMYGLCSDPGSTRFSSHYFNISSKQVSSSTTTPKTTTSTPTSTKQSSFDPAMSTSTSAGAAVGTAKSTTPVDLCPRNGEGRLSYLVPIQPQEYHITRIMNYFVLIQSQEQSIMNGKAQEINRVL
ncbi:hypothetical protein IFM61606_00496 [Aspergillus udagawae]|uniref:Uncharacterized protein n=1 Tax=Aspergillus udagawae TaxID=91492 RepID=A0ABQ1AJ79_9EURO|nr:hypothetical protein IFM53868_03627 [Aspergillus udagawae]GFG20353.1 hypothetical protein IFM61606_00496 [Aspergillus udagawae]